ncbi:MAG TPA: hypothetical protein PKI03_00900 [Pseudomonadota bacterium]|nr:hypothetical protein [Pseudomonadota bacterium]
MRIPPALPCLHRWILGALVLPLGGLGLGACTLTLDLQASQTLNMRSPAASQGTSAVISELLEVAIFQLKTVPEEQQRQLLTKLEAEWPQHRSQMAIYRAKGTFPESLAPFLAYPATTLEIKRPAELFVINPGERYMREIPLRVATSHLLVITLGSKASLRSIQLFDVGGTTGTLSLCFHQYDVYRYEREKPWYCPQHPAN